jgi:hypothetical protein
LYLQNCLILEDFADLCKICNLVVSNPSTFQCLRIGEDWMWVTEDRIGLVVVEWHKRLGVKCVDGRCRLPEPSNVDCEHDRAFHDLDLAPSRSAK